MEILKNAYRIPVLNIDDTQGIVNILNSPEFQEIYSFYAQQIPANSVLNNLPDLEKLGNHLPILEREAKTDICSWNSSI